jgi:hypothetical protein
MTIHGDLMLVTPHGGPPLAHSAWGKAGHQQNSGDGPRAELPGPSNDTSRIEVAEVPVETMTVFSPGASAPRPEVHIQ